MADIEFETKKEKIKKVYEKLAKVLQTEEIVLVGGSAMLLTADHERKLNDLDVAVPPKALVNVPATLAHEMGFEMLMDGSKLMTLTDAETGLEAEVSAKNCGNLNAKLGLPKYTDEKPTILGLDLWKVISDSVIVDGIRTPSPFHQVLMKYNLWRFRGNGEVLGQKDAEDIRKLLAFYYKGSLGLFYNSFNDRDLANCSIDAKQFKLDVGLISNPASERNMAEQMKNSKA